MSQAGEVDGPEALLGPGKSWSERYGARHRFQRIKDFPHGIAAPKKVRLYHRLDHYVLQWWDPAARKNVADRVDGDLVSAIARARLITVSASCRVDLAASGRGR